MQPLLGVLPMKLLLACCTCPGRNMLNLRQGMAESHGLDCSEGPAIRLKHARNVCPLLRATF